MGRISAEGKFTLLKNNGYGQIDPAEFTVSVDRGLQAVVEIDYDSNSIITTIRDINVPDDFAEELKGIGRFELEKVPGHLLEDLSFIYSSLSIASKTVVSLLKYHLRHMAISEQLFSIRGATWTTGDGEYNDLPSSLSGSISWHSTELLRANTIVNIQSSIDESIEPLIAMRHLHRAQEENIAHHKWIDATIAAELAVKEVLSSKKPELEVLLMEMPSPPLAKLYGSILEEYLGERSPYLKFIREGVEVRNRLVHKPYAESIDLQVANNYVRHIEGAIFHLLSIIHPENQLILNAYEQVKL
jgi:hypothetical protein